ncbi:MAG: DUF58 domain-containing protein [Planctomycetes bacterium]|nr:DUF58 domain-containing protein [Planctomycetota bacterium]
MNLRGDETYLPRWSVLMTLSATALVLAYLYDSFLLVAVSASLLTIQFSSFALIHYQISRLKITRMVYQRAFEDSEVEVFVIVENLGLLPAFFIEFEDKFYPGKPQNPSLFFDAVKRRESIVQSYEGTCSRGRGAFIIGPANVYISDPFYIFRIRGEVDIRSDLLVYPKPEDLTNIDALRTKAAQIVGTECVDTRSGHSANFLGVREFRSGDNPRHIDFRNSAKCGQLIIKEFEYSSSMDVTIFIDFFRGARLGFGRTANLEYSIKIVASLIARIAADGHRASLIGVREKKLVYCEPARSEMAVYSMLEELALSNSDGGVPLEEIALDLSDHVFYGGTVVFVVSKLFSESIDKWAVAFATYKAKGANAIVIRMLETGFVAPVLNPRIRAEKAALEEIFEGLCRDCGVTFVRYRKNDSIAVLFEVEELEPNFAFSTKKKAIPIEDDESAFSSDVPRAIPIEIDDRSEERSRPARKPLSWD